MRTCQDAFNGFQTLCILSQIAGGVKGEYWTRASVRIMLAVTDWTHVAPGEQLAEVQGWALDTMRQPFDVP